ncbi:hypothetical protein KDAU_07590 [Dictyobacter aurantiacus]|uniref:Uncharacterized protein n=1 Tax=Dictyobacter aurantiacus TaxID=1936993 RepID=A0A401Z988_9CHLR|nr:hypothetical protein KDAU_07590 [Dictyobacter aurantiacus]
MYQTFLTRWPIIMLFVGELFMVATLGTPKTQGTKNIRKHGWNNIGAAQVLAA